MRNYAVTRDPRAVQIYTDGSAYKNPGHASGCAAIARYPEHMRREDEVILDFGCPRSTNQRMELMACIKALEWVRRNVPWSGVASVLVIADSKHVVDFVGLAPIWKKNEWRNAEGQSISNRDLWNDLIKARSKAGIRVDFLREQGKTTDLGKRVDKLAKAAAKRGGPDSDTGYVPGSVCRSMAQGGKALPYPAKGDTATIRPFAKKPLSNKEERVSFNLFVEATRTYESKFYAFTTPQMACDLHRWHGYRVLFNDNPDYPQILECKEEVEIPTRYASHSPEP
jgi:ribonuclease HI